MFYHECVIILTIIIIISVSLSTFHHHHQYHYEDDLFGRTGIRNLKITIKLDQYLDLLGRIRGKHSCKFESLFGVVGNLRDSLIFPAWAIFVWYIAKRDALKRKRIFVFVSLISEYLRQPRRLSVACLFQYSLLFSFTSADARCYTSMEVVSAGQS